MLWQGVGHLLLKCLAPERSPTPGLPFVNPGRRLRSALFFGLVVAPGPQLSRCGCATKSRWPTDSASMVFQHYLQLLPRAVRPLSGLLFVRE